MFLEITYSSYITPLDGENYLRHVLLIAVSGLKCSLCSSKTSLEDCDENRKEENCGSGLDFCSTFIHELNETSKSFSRSCNTKVYCDNVDALYQACKPLNQKCIAYCCDKDLCNTGPAPTTVPTQKGATVHGLSASSILGHASLWVLLYNAI